MARRSSSANDPHAAGEGNLPRSFVVPPVGDGAPDVSGDAGLWRRYVAIGDSFSEGLNDPDPATPNRFLGWTDRLAHGLARHAAASGEEFRYANLAIRGRLIADIVGRQFPEALALQPDLISLVGGGNDLLRPHGDPDAIASLIEGSVMTARSAGIDVLLATPTDPRGAGVFSLTRSRAAVLTAHLHSIARRHGAYVVDQWGLRAIQDWRVWSEDRLHMTPAGHEVVARAGLRALGVDLGDPEPEPLPPAEPSHWRETARESAVWARDHARPWVHRRLTGRSSGDGLDPKRPTLDLLDPEAAPPRV